MQTKGKNIMLFLGGSAIAMSTNHILNVNPKLDETVTKDDAEGPAAAIDYVDWDCSADSVVGESGVTNEETFASLIESQIGGATIAVVLDAVTAATADQAVPADGWENADSSSVFTPKRSGNALISEITIDAPADGFATMNVALVGKGALS